MERNFEGVKYNDMNQNQIQRRVLLLAILNICILLQEIYLIRWLTSQSGPG
jgi:hypothetical protein